MNKQEKERLLSTYGHEKGLSDLYWLLDNAGIKEYGGEKIMKCSLMFLRGRSARCSMGWLPMHK